MEIFPAATVDAVGVVWYKKQFGFGGVEMVQQRAFILVETRVGKTMDVAKAIRGVEIQGVVGVDTVTGPYDIIVTVGREARGDLVAFLEKVSGIVRTVTCVAVSDWDS